MSSQNPDPNGAPATSPNGSRRGRLRRRLDAGDAAVGGRRRAIAVTAGLAAAGLVSGLLVATGVTSPEDVDGKRNLGAASEGCSTATSSSVAATAGHQPKRATSLAAGPALAGDLGAEGEGGGSSLFIDILKELGSNAGDWTEEQGLGWGLSMLTGAHGDPNSAAIQQSLTDLTSKVDGLEDEVSTLCVAMSDELNRLVTNNTRGTYSTQASQLQKTLTNLDDHQADYHDIRKDLIAHNGDVSALSGDSLKALSNMRDDLPDDITSISDALVNGQAEADAMLELYKQLLADTYGYTPTSTNDPAQARGTGIFPAEYVNSGYVMMDRYATYLVQATTLYSEVMHITFTFNGETYQADDGTKVGRQVKAVQDTIATWGAAFASDEGKSNRPGMGRIPEGTFVDYRDSNNPRLWTDQPISAVTGAVTTDADDAAWSCGSTAAFCFADDYDTNGDITATRLIQPSTTAADKSVESVTVNGLGGWRLPSASEWSTLASPPSGKGLTSWGSSVGTSIFASKEVDGSYGGQTTKLTSILPVLATSGSGYELLGAADATTSKLTSYATTSGQSDLAGRVFAVQDFVPGQAAPMLSSQAEPHPTRGPAHSRKAPAKKHTAMTVGAADSDGTFTQPSACNSGTTYTVPQGVNAVKITTNGGAGGTGNISNSNNAGAAGGSGGQASAIVPVTPGSKLFVQVGGKANGTQGGVGGGGNGGTGSWANAGGGGGASGVATTSDCSQWLVLAGGGGGGGATASPKTHNNRGGDACWAGGQCTGAGDGAADTSNNKDAGGKAGQPAPKTAGGAGGSSYTPQGSAKGTPGSAGTNSNGGDGGGATGSKQAFPGGGGGGGYFGGGGGGGAAGDVQGDGGGGAGGNSYIVGNADYQQFGHNDVGAAGSVTIAPVDDGIAGGISMTSSATSVDYGQSPTLTAHVDSKATGQVQFHDLDITSGDQWVGSAPVSNGMAVLSQLTQLLSPGTHRLQAYYPGDGHYQEEWAQVTVTVNKATPNVTVTTSTDMVAAGGTVIFTATMNPDINGVIDFYDGAQPTPNKAIGSAKVVNGVATLTQLSRPLVKNSNTKIHSQVNDVWTWFDGNDNYLGHQSPAVSVEVITPAAEWSKN